MAQKKKPAARPVSPPPRRALWDLLAAARGHPEDDATRLVLADWLEDHGDEVDRARAEHIRLQIQVAPLRLNDPARVEPERRIKELEDRHQAEWLGPLHRKVRVHFERGLPQVSLSGGRLVALSAAWGHEVWA